MAAQANFEKSVYAKTARTNARGEGACTGYLCIVPACCSCPARCHVRRIAQELAAACVPLMLYHRSACCKLAPSASALPTAAAAAARPLPPAVVLASLCCLQLRSLCLTTWWWCTSSLGTSCST